MATDTGPWIERGDPTNPNWRKWVFETRHFQVGYRPVTALTFTAGTWLLGVKPLVVRGTDVLLHLMTALAVFLFLLRALRQLRGAGLAALVGLLLFLMHPAIEEVVPLSARRSYTLALLFGCAGLWWGSAPVATNLGALLRSLTCGVLLVLALWSNETAAGLIVFLPMLLALVDRRECTLIRRLVGATLRSMLPAILVGLALYVRWRVVGGVGGYVIKEDGVERSGAIGVKLLQDLSGLGFWNSGAGLDRWAPVAVSLWAFILTAGLAAATLSLWKRAGHWRVLPLAAWLWLIAFATLFISQRVWFPRQAHALLPPLALAIASMVLAAVTGQGKARRVAGLAAAAIFAVALVSSPILRGIQPERQEKWQLRQQLINDLLSAKELEPNSRVVCVLPFRIRNQAQLKAKVAGAKLPRDARQPFVWAKYLLKDVDLELREFLYIEEEAWEWDRRVSVAEEEERPSVRVPLDRKVLLLRFRSPKRRKPEQGEIEDIPARTAPGEHGPDYLFLYEAGGGAFVRAPLAKKFESKNQ